LGPFFRLICCIPLMGAVAISIVKPTLAGSCCGGSSGGVCIIPKTARGIIDLSFNLERYNGFWNQEGIYTPDPPGSRISQYRLNLGVARRLWSSGQAAIMLPYTWNDNRYSGLATSTDNLGDATVGLWYEALSDITAWKIGKLKDFMPSLLIGPSLLIPTGISPYDEVKSSFDVTGRGFYRLDGNILLSKMLHPWSASITLGYGTAIGRPVNREYGKYVAPYRKNLGDRFSASTSLGYRYYIGTAGDALTGTATFSHLQEGNAVISGRDDLGSGLRKDAIGGTMAYSSTDRDWIGRGSWMHSIKTDGWGATFPATDVFTLGVSYAIR
jgi:hypothetical protein